MYSQLEVNGNLVKIEIDAPTGSMKAGGLETMKTTFDSARKIIADMAQEFVATAKEVGSQIQPDKMSVKFGLKVDANASWVIAKVGSGINFEISLSWNKKSELG